MMKIEIILEPSEYDVTMSGTDGPRKDYRAVLLNQNGIRLWESKYVSNDRQALTLAGNILGYLATDVCFAATEGTKLVPPASLLRMAEMRAEAIAGDIHA